MFVEVGGRFAAAAGTLVFVLEAEVAE